MVKLVLPTLFLLYFTLTVHSFDLTFTTPYQCGRLNISWSGSAPAQLKFPLFIHILPFASTAFRATIPTSVWNDSNTSGALTMHFDYSGGTQFLVAVVDSEGVGAGPVSQITTAVKSPDASCIRTQSPSSPAHFIALTTPDPSACPSILVSWDSNVTTVRPTVLAFSPGMLPFNLDPLNAPVPINRTVEFVGNFNSTSQVVVLFDDNVSPRRTSDLLTVGGTDAACPSPPGSAPPSTQMVTQAAGGDSKNHAGILVGAVAAAVVGVAIIIFGILAYRQRHERHMHGLIPHSRVFENRSSVSTIRRSFLPSMGMPTPSPRSFAPPPPKNPRASTRPPAHGESFVSLPPSPAPPSPSIKSPSLRLAKRHSYISGPSSDVPSPQYMSPISNGASAESWTNEQKPRPDSATLPDPTFSRQLTEPTLPVSPRSAGSAGHTPHATARGGAGELRSPSSSTWAKKVH